MKEPNADFTGHSKQPEVYDETVLRNNKLLNIKIFNKM